MGDPSNDNDRVYWIFDSEHGWTTVRNPDPATAVMDYAPSTPPRIRRYEIIKTFTRTNLKERVHIVRRMDGVFQYVHENWYRNVYEGQLIAEGWRTPSFSGGLFADAELAEQNATLQYPWLSSSDQMG